MSNHLTTYIRQLFCILLQKQTTTTTTMKVSTTSGEGGMSKDHTFPRVFFVHPAT